MNKAQVYSLLTASTVFLVAAIVRFYNLDLRPLQFDEAVNFNFISKLLSSNEVIYNSADFHGTFLFYFNRFLINWLNLSTDCSSVLGNDSASLCLELSERNFRTSSVLIGSFLCLIPFFISSITLAVATIVSLFLCFSPSLIFLSQQNIHEIYFSFFSSCFLILLYEFIKDNKIKKLFFLSIAFGLMIATKETWIITVFIGFVLSCLFFKEKLSTVLLSWIKLTPISLLIAAPFYLGLDSPINSLDHLFKGIVNWGKIGLSGRNQSKSSDFYLKTIFEAEPSFYWLVLVVLVSIVIKNYFKIEESPVKNSTTNNSGLDLSLELFLTLSSVLFLLIYSLLPYKTPWLIVTIIVPSIIGVGIYLAKYCNKSINLVVICILLLLNYKTYLINDPKLPHPLQPIPSYQGVRDLAQVVQNTCTNITDCKVLVITRLPWPIPFYLQNYSKRTSYINSRSSVDPSYIDRFDIVVEELFPLQKGDSSAKKFVVNARLRVEVKG